MTVIDRLRESTVQARKKSATDSLFHSVLCIFLCPLVVVLYLYLKKSTIIHLSTAKCREDANNAILYCCLSQVEKAKLGPMMLLFAFKLLTALGILDNYNQLGLMLVVPFSLG